VLAFAERMALPQLGAPGATAACLWLFFWRRGLRADDRYIPPATYLPRDRTLFRVAAAACAAFIVGILAGAPLALVSCLCAGLLLVTFAARARGQLRWTLVPWRLLVFVSGLFLVVQTVSRHGLSTVLDAVIGTDPGAMGCCARRAPALGWRT
jgi:arsenical pump membrane protein